MILFDTVLDGAARANDDDHLACAQVLRLVPANERLVPATVIAETAYLLQTKGNRTPRPGSSRTWPPETFASPNWAAQT